METYQNAELKSAELTFDRVLLELDGVQVKLARTKLPRFTEQRPREVFIVIGKRRYDARFDDRSGFYLMHPSFTDEGKISVKFAAYPDLSTYTKTLRAIKDFPKAPCAQGIAVGGFVLRPEGQLNNEVQSFMDFDRYTRSQQ